jgi:hypothetical protein
MTSSDIRRPIHYKNIVQGSYIYVFLCTVPVAHIYMYGLTSFFVCTNLSGCVIMNNLYTCLICTDVQHAIE